MMDDPLRDAFALAGLPDWLLLFVVVAPLIALGVYLVRNR